MDEIRIPELKDISFRQPLPLPHMQPIGHLPMTPEAAALWQFLVCAFQALDRVPKQTTLVGNEDQSVDLKAVANSIRMLYQLKDLDRMFNANLIRAAKKEAARSRLPWDSRIDAWFATGGQSYRFVDRDADKVGQ